MKKLTDLPQYLQDAITKHVVSLAASWEGVCRDTSIEEQELVDACLRFKESSTEHQWRSPETAPRVTDLYSEDETEHFIGYGYEERYSDDIIACECVPHLETRGEYDCQAVHYFAPASSDGYVPYDHRMILLGWMPMPAMPEREEGGGVNE